MAVRERSLGPLYVARVPLGVDWCPPHVGGIVQMHEPWRKGKALVLPLWKRWGIATGVWRRTRATLSEDLAGEQWLDPHWMDTPVDDIALWGADEETKDPGSGALV